MCRLALFRIIDLLIEKGSPIMLVGAAGTGKTVLMNDKLKSLSDDLTQTHRHLNANVYSNDRKG